MELLQTAFVVGFLGGVMGGGVVIMVYATVSRFMYKKRHAQLVEDRKKQMNRARHLAELEAGKKKGKNK